MTLHAPTSSPRIPEHVAAAAYRILDEALTNVVRRSGASTCAVDVKIDGDLVLSVADNGVGPGPGRVGGVGLTSMRDRAERLGGTFEIRGGSFGTHVCVRIPMGEP